MKTSDSSYWPETTLVPQQQPKMDATLFMQLPQQHDKEEEVLTDQQLLKQEMDSSLDQEEPKPPQIKEEEKEPEPPQVKEENEDVHISQEGEQLVLKGETDMEVQSKSECEEPSSVLENNGIQNEEETVDQPRLLNVVTNHQTKLQTVTSPGVQLHKCHNAKRRMKGDKSLQADKPEEEMAAPEKMKENSVISLKGRPFTQRSLEEKKRLKELGPNQPDLKIQQQASDRGRSYTRGFSRSCYEKRSWLAGCDASNAFFCFPCLLFQSVGTEVSWTTTGVKDLKHLSEKCKRHENSRSHLENSMKLELFGRAGIAEQLNEVYRVGIRNHNEEVAKNRQILSRMIDCVKFCGAFEVALCGHDESETLENGGIFPVDLVASLDTALKELLDNALVFKRTSKTVQNELLGCMLSVAKEQIITEARSSDFLSIQVDETMDIATQSQLVLVLRYIDGNNDIQERFLEFICPEFSTAESIAAALKERLAAVLPENQKSKLICQTYDGANVMKGAAASVRRKILDEYSNAHYIHGYAHQLSLIMQQVTSHISKVRIFFSDLGGFDSFFSRSPKRTGVLDKVVARRLPASGSVKWDFHSRAISTVFEHRDDLLHCFESIRESGDFDSTTIREAGAFAMLLENQDFNFFLELFYKIMPHVDFLYAKLQKYIDSVHVKESLQQFEYDIQKVRNSIYSLGDPSSGPHPAKRSKTLSPEDREKIAEKVCDTIIGHTRERFSFTHHLVCATLLQGDRFAVYREEFPDCALSTTLKAYPMLNRSKLKTELGLIYSKEEFKTCRGALDLFQMFMGNNLEEVFSETVTLLKIVITTPMTTAEADRCFSTSKKIKTFLRNTVIRERLNALAMLSVEKRLVTEMSGFNQRVIEKFASQKERRAKFMFK